MIRTAKTYKPSSWGATTRYYEYLPSNGVKPIGVILFYHGMGERSTSNLSLVEANPLPKFLKVDGVRDGVELPFIVLAPQEEPPSEWYGRAIDCVKLAKTYNLPIHKCGLSLGSMIDAEILNNPETLNCFASVATVCGKINEYPTTLESLKKIPTIHFYGTADNTIANGYASVKAMYNKLKSSGADTTLVEYQGAGHSIWNQAYSTTALNGYLNWLKTKFPAVPVEPPVPVTRLNIVKTEVDISTGRIIHTDVNGKEY